MARYRRLRRMTLRMRRRFSRRKYTSVKPGGYHM